MRSLVIGFFGLSLLFFAAQTPALAGWCAVLKVGGTSCGFTTFEQCMATVSGIGGSCYQDRTPDPQPASPQKKKKKQPA
ncbi:MAG: DUF3551 domain-containing protein [Rhizobiales bacterium]|nr:DUF3551 domain-containing protein [Hyphomicrobiales bacterium]